MNLMIIEKLFGQYFDITLAHQFLHVSTSLRTTNTIRVRRENYYRYNLDFLCIRRRITDKNSIVKYL